MSEVAQVITAIAALVTAIGGASAAIIVALQAFRRQREAAAREAARLTSRRGNAQVGRGDPGAAHRHRKNSGSRRRSELALEAEDLAAEESALTRELVKDARDIARDLARDNRELALETQREARFTAIEHDILQHEPPPSATPGDGVDA